ncbi:predicted protein [Naegleria gruberi]|uniref:Predicted protein n=1 Tax=Naegleria gruberi TaxID=5762 RepID=D2W1I2_NAEGR|nr:uncharacterized protein NAEGRDRAFT_75230 [Naegleria gruberi]EFC37049.1 predicted protein [Naegleria gruberi]|eukprot:XP_002669793.1 predicted protein [Naegleria gruberi strain NEG-M]
MSQLSTTVVYTVITFIVLCPPLAILLMRFYPKDHYDDLKSFNLHILISFVLLTICYFIPEIDGGFRTQLKQFYFYLFLKGIVYIPAILHASFMFFAWGLTVENHK